MARKAENIAMDTRAFNICQLQGVDAPAHVSLRPNCGPWKLKDILVLWHCWRYETNSALILLVSGNYCISRWL